MMKGRGTVSNRENQRPKKFLFFKQTKAIMRCLCRSSRINPQTGTGSTRLAIWPTHLQVTSLSLCA